MSLVENYLKIAKKEVWFVRYCISIFLLIFFCCETHLLVHKCLSPDGCREGMAPWAMIFEGLKAGIMGTFMVIILGKGIQPLINMFTAWRFGNVPYNPQADSDAAAAEAVKKKNQVAPAAPQQVTNVTVTPQAPAPVQPPPESGG